MLEKFKKVLKHEKEHKIRSLKHLVITTHGVKPWAEKEKKTIEEAYKKSFEILNEIINLQTEQNIPILTIYLMPEGLKRKEYFPFFLNSLVAFFEKLLSSDNITNNKIKVSMLGKWYDLPGRAVEPLKEIIEETRDYDGFFLNFCINYNGQEEIVDACKLIARQVKVEKIDADAINKAIIKDSVYSSYFLPPDLIIKNGERQTSGIMLWDSPYSKIYFTDKYWPEFNKHDFFNAIKEYQKD
ncbi:di-trans,poly-cis-decaprenylcistransferase [Candidatus Woesearchaeota archaeon]|nr:di-trans,poly-cis-decaprenylcistransferase [Candidatus Woesearchaeota archaeon]